MSSTRYASHGSPLSQNRHMSDPAYAAQRGISGSGVAAKSSLLLRHERELVFFIQSLSLPQPRKSGSDDLLPTGTKKIAAELLEMFPERLGSKTMRALEMKHGAKFSEADGEMIRDELRCTKELSPAGYLEWCRQRFMDQVPNLLVRLCIDPTLRPVTQPGITRRAVIEVFYASGDSDYEPSEVEDLDVPFFHDITGALYEYQKRYAQRALAEFVTTSIAKPVFEKLDYALENRKCVLIRGNSGIGKSEAVRAWADMHRGQARYVSLKGINHRTAFFRAIAKACGVGSTFTLSASKVQARVEDYLENTGLLLIVDEGQYLFSGQKRIEKEPELINWLDTACFNNGVPFAIVATKEFDQRRRAVEEQTTWSSHQLARRIKGSVLLPDVPSDADMQAVAKKRLPNATVPMIKLIVGYAITSKRFMDGIVEVIEDAAWLCGKGNRVGYDELKRAISETRAPSDASLKRALHDEAPKRRRHQDAGTLQEASNGHAGDVPEQNFPSRSGLAPVGRGRTVEALAVG